MPHKKKDDKGGPRGGGAGDEGDAQAQLPTEDTGTFVFDNNARYCGQFVRREGGLVRRHGGGNYSDGFFTYDGQWKEDVMHGEASVTFASGASYIGTVVDGKFDGRGTYKWPDGSLYVGQWRFNRVHGEGVYTDAEGVCWKGRFYNGTGPGLQHKAAELATAVATARKSNAAAATSAPHAPLGHGSSPPPPMAALLPLGTTNSLSPPPPPPVAVAAAKR